MPTEQEIFPLSDEDIKDEIKDLQKGICEEKKLQEWYRTQEKQYPHLEGARQISIEHQRLLQEDLDEWKQELRRRVKKTHKTTK